MEGSQTIIEPPQVDDTHASSRSAGKKPQIFSFGELAAFEQLADKQTSRIGPLASVMIQITRHKRLCMMIWGSNYWIIVLRDSILVSLLVSSQIYYVVAELRHRWPDRQVSSSTCMTELS
jgi:hypothetical protein